MKNRLSKTTALGQMLLEREWITERQLEAALARPRNQGGHLGTALLELDSISEDLLIRVLADQLEVPAADIEDLRDIPPEVVALLPAKNAIRARAVPFRDRRGRVDVALLEIDNLPLQDELSFILGRGLRAHIANEVRIFEALEQYYGKTCPMRYRGLLERLNRQRDRWKSRPERDSPPSREPAAPAPPQPNAPAPPRAGGEASAAQSSPTKAGRSRRPGPPPPPSQRSIPLSPEERLSLGARRRQAPAASTAASPTAAATATADSSREAPTAESTAPASGAAPHATREAELLAAFRRRVEGARTSSEIGEMLLGALSEEFVRSLLFRVARGVVSGWMASAPDLTAERFSTYSTNMVQPSVFRQISESGGSHIGPLPDLPPHRQLRGLWGGHLDTECLVSPLKVRDRLVSIVYGDRDALGVAGIDIGLVQQLVALASEAMERRILERKLGSAGRR